ncbi:MAG: hypothetical protein VX603_11355 [Gemmatimonadota bacterium]|nr:hypothetical protein [Gemmatimonadota bacterium]
MNGRNSDWSEKAAKIYDLIGRGARCGGYGKETTPIVYISGLTAIRGQSGCLYVLTPPGVIERRSIEDGLELSL